MNQGNLILSISEKTNVDEKDVKLVLDALKNVVLDAITSQETVVLHNFGVFSASFKEERKNVLGKYDVPAHMAPRFTFSQNVKKAVKA